MKLLNATVFLLPAIVVFAFACNSSKKTQSSANTEEVFVPVSDIVLYDKPLDTIKKHVAGQRWRLIYSIGGITGDDRHMFDSTFYTLTKGGKLITEKAGKREEAPYAWEENRDIFTGNNIYVITGVVQWKVEGIYSDTLRLADNYVDGYSYALVRVK